MQYVLIALLAGVLTAGCSDAQNPIKGDSETTGAPHGNEPVLHFATGWLNDTSSRVHGMGGVIGLTGSNCAYFGNEDLKRIILGWANVSWTSSNPAADDMMLTVYGADPRYETKGPSPLGIEIRDMRSDENTPILIFLRTAMDAGVDIEVEMHLNWTFYYEGAENLVHETSGCG